ncbi:HK97 family phage major capsid protein [Epilithonimonas hungarica]|uniref:phage major capsid family protein n=1 Tax=Epilithonimonas hungarica TaxID=454006 RepID=UPI0027885200|nr:phage major capsid protein [Epilithonimonas hungarica]MDP9954690.1 HK97 family phage major capsid protein [Epilithonimonas hungarica]
MFKKFLEKKKISAEQFKEMEAEKQMELQNEYLGEIEKQVENSISKERLDEIIKEAAEKRAEEMKEINEELKVVKEELKSSNTINWNNVSEKLEKFITDNHEKIKSAFKTKGSIEIDEEIIKAVGIVTTANGTLPVALPVNYVAQTSGVPNVRLRRPNLLDYVNTYSTNQKSLPYIEALPGEGEFAIVAEGGVKPQLDIDWVTRWAEPQKFAGWIKVTEEAIEDIPRLRDLIVNYLKDKHDLFKEGVVYTYIAANSTAFVTGGPLADSVKMPTIMDVVNALQLQIINTPNYTDEPDFFGDVVLMNVSDFYKYFGAAKDAFGRPLFENGYQGGRTFNYNGYTFVATTKIAVGSIELMDSTKIDVTTYSPYRVEIGWVNDDFIKNQFVILGESRGHIVIKNHDKRAFVKGVIATIIADLEEPAV